MASFLDPDFLLRVFLVFGRIGGLMVVAPLFGHRAVPVRVRVLFAAMLAWALVGLVPGPLPPNATDLVGLLIAVVIEVLTGVVLGFAAQFIFWTIQFAGEVIGFQMGLSMAQIYNPAEGLYANPLGRLLSLSFLMVFLLIDGHHHVLRALVGSFDVVPLAGAHLAATGPLLLKWMGLLFVTAMRLASPFMVTIFLVDAALGVFARVVPQADLFSLGLPLKLLAGLALMYFFLQNFFPVIPDLVALMLHDLLELIEALAGV
ncbi:MAG: flagellar biosynthetic protein FliR [Bacteroidetes bacterium]|nr:flagellar biosynthetic protein FliR [Bacteroidota bacterium]